MNEFDCDKFKTVVKEKFVTYEKYVDLLNNVYGLEKKLNTVQKWGQSSSSNVPTAKELPIIAKSLGLEIIDLYVDANKSRQKIVQDELASSPERYTKSISNAFLSTLPQDLSELLNYFQVLDEEDRKKYLDEIREKALSKLNGN